MNTPNVKQFLQRTTNLHKTYDRPQQKRNTKRKKNTDDIRFDIFNPKRAKIEKEGKILRRKDPKVNDYLMFACSVPLNDSNPSFTCKVIERGTLHNIPKNSVRSTHELYGKHACGMYVSYPPHAPTSALPSKTHGVPQEVSLVLVFAGNIHQFEDRQTGFFEPV